VSLIGSLKCTSAESKSAAVSNSAFSTQQFVGELVATADGCVLSRRDQPVPASDSNPVVWVRTNEMANDSGTLRCDLPQAPKLIATVTIAATLRTRIGRQ